MYTTKALYKHTEVQYPDNCYLLFGKETRGLPEHLLMEHKESCVRIPMVKDARSLNLSNSVAIAAYEVLRHQGFKAFQMEGQLHHYKW